MNHYKIKPVQKDLSPVIQKALDEKTKPPGSLGQLENFALKLGLIQKTTKPEIKKPLILVFAGDHGITVEKKVNPYPREVTWQMVKNFLSGGAAINVLSRQAEAELFVIDAGVDYDFQSHPQLIQAKIGRGTADYRYGPAMRPDQLQAALDKGIQIARKKVEEGFDIIGFGEMGIGNTSSASLLMSTLLELELKDCVGRGSGMDDEGLRTKQEVLQKAMDLHKLLAQYGGFEIAMMCGAMIETARQQVPLIIDGFISTAALLTAKSMASDAILDYCFFSHLSAEKPHRLMLQSLDTKPLIELDMRLGEGSGAAIVLPTLSMACAILREMASFSEAGVHNK